MKQKKKDKTSRHGSAKTAISKAVTMATVVASLGVSLGVNVGDVLADQANQDKQKLKPVITNDRSGHGVVTNQLKIDGKVARVAGKTVTVNDKNGISKTFEVNDPKDLRTGDTVTVNNGVIEKINGRYVGGSGGK